MRNLEEEVQKRGGEASLLKRAQRPPRFNLKEGFDMGSKMEIFKEDKDKKKRGDLYE